MNDHDPENLRATDRKMRTSQATIAMPNGSHQQLGQHTRCNILPQAVAFVCAKLSVDTGACLIDGALDFGFSLFATRAGQKTKRANRDRLARLVIDSLMPQLFLL